jgi:quercetin dioxygenase-like cupin family protein
MILEAIMKHTAFYMIAVVSIGFALSNNAVSGQESPKMKVTPLQREALTGQPEKEVVTVLIEWPPGAGTGLHTHPGDEYTTVLEGEFVGRRDGAESKTYTAGQSYHNEPGVVHEGTNKGNVAAQTFNVFVIDKGKPITQPFKP